MREFSHDNDKYSPLNGVYRIAHEMSRMVYHFRRDGCLETVGPAGELFRPLHTLLATVAHCFLYRVEWIVTDVSRYKLASLTLLILIFSFD